MKLCPIHRKPLACLSCNAAKGGHANKSVRGAHWRKYPKCTSGWRHVFNSQGVCKCGILRKEKTE